MSRPLGLGLCAFLLLAAAAPPPVRAGGPRSAPSGATLEQLSRHAGFIFRGRVLRVERLRPAAGSPATVQVTFQVLEGIRGTRTVEILSGLADGEQVASPATADLSDGKRVHILTSP